MEKNRQGLLHIYCGDGKGKTSAAVGMAVRAAGCGMKVLVIRFLKTENSGEVEVLRSIPGITVPPCERTFGFVFRMTEEQKQEAALYYQSRFEAAAKEAVQGQYDLLILDEILGLVDLGIITCEDVIRLIDMKDESVELIMTGRHLPEELIPYADYISRLDIVKGACSEKPSCM